MSLTLFCRPLTSSMQLSSTGHQHYYLTYRHFSFSPVLTWIFFPVCSKILIHSLTLCLTPFSPLSLLACNRSVVSQLEDPDAFEENLTIWVCLMFSHDWNEICIILARIPEKRCVLLSVSHQGVYNVDCLAGNIASSLGCDVPRECLLGFSPVRFLFFFLCSQ